MVRDWGLSPPGLSPLQNLLPSPFTWLLQASGPAQLLPKGLKSLDIRAPPQHGSRLPQREAERDDLVKSCSPLPPNLRSDVPPLQVTKTNPGTVGGDHRVWGVNVRRRGSLGPSRIVATQGPLIKNFGVWGGLGAGPAPGPDSFAAGAKQKRPHAPSRSPNPGPASRK